MAATGTFTVDSSGAWLTAISACSSIFVCESAQAGTASWTIQAPSDSSTAITVPAGAGRTFGSGPNIFVPGQKIAFLKSTGSSMTFDQLEDC